MSRTFHREGKGREGKGREGEASITNQCTKRLRLSRRERRVRRLDSVYPEVRPPWSRRKVSGEGRTSRGDVLPTVQGKIACGALRKGPK